MGWSTYPQFARETSAVGPSVRLRACRSPLRPQGRAARSTESTIGNEGTARQPLVPVALSPVGVSPVRDVRVGKRVPPNAGLCGTLSPARLLGQRAAASGCRRPAGPDDYASIRRRGVRSSGR